AGTAVRTVACRRPDGARGRRQTAVGGRALFPSGNGLGSAGAARRRRPRLGGAAVPLVPGGRPRRCASAPSVRSGTDRPARLRSGLSCRFFGLDFSPSPLPAFLVPRAAGMTLGYVRELGRVVPAAPASTRIFTTRKNMQIRPFLSSFLVSLLVAGAASAHAHGYTAGSIRIEHPWARATAPGQ